MSEIDLLIQELRDTIDNQIEEIDRLNNIIDELSKWLKENSKESQLFESDRYYKHVLDKLKELKENNK